MIDEQEYKLAISKYDDMDSAHAIWQSYEPELRRFDELLNQGFSLLECCNDSLVLDVGLHHLLESRGDSRVRGLKLSTVPLESEVEDWAVIDPTKYVDLTESGHGSFPHPRL